MVTCRCIKKFRDKHGKIYGYRIANARGFARDIDTDALKEAIRNGEFEVDNLTLTSDNRLVNNIRKCSENEIVCDSIEKQLNKTKG